MSDVNKITIARDFHCHAYYWNAGLHDSCTLQAADYIKYDVPKELENFECTAESVFPGEESDGWLLVLCTGDPIAKEPSEPAESATQTKGENMSDPKTLVCNFSYQRNSNDKDVKIPARPLPDTKTQKSEHSSKLGDPSNPPPFLASIDTYVEADGHKFNIRAFINKDHRANIWIQDSTEKISKNQQATSTASVTEFAEGQILHGYQAFHPDIPEVLSSSIWVDCVIKAVASEPAAE